MRRADPDDWAERRGPSRSDGTLIWVLGLGLAAIIGVAIIAGGSRDGGGARSPSAAAGGGKAGATFETPRYELLNLEGTWMEADGLRGFRVTASNPSGTSRLPGRLDFIPKIGDWTAPVRCGVSGAHLIVEIPAPSGTFVAQLFQVESINRATSRIEPWEGEYQRR